MRYEASVGGMDCGSCAAKIEHVVSGLEGVQSVSVDLTLARMRVELEAEGQAETVDNAVRGLGYTVASIQGGARRELVPEEPMWKDPRLVAVLIGLVATAIGVALQSIPAFIVGIVAGGVYVFRNAFTSARHLHLDINVLMTIAVVGAMAIGEWFEAATVVVLFAFAEWLEGASMTRARRAIRDLMELAPPMARVLRGGQELELALEDIAVGEVVLVRPGEKIPLDGTVKSGTSEIDQSSLTGESNPVSRTVDDEVFAGTLNTMGTLQVTVDKPAGDSTIAHVVRAIEDARENRSESERFIEKFARYYTPAVVIIAVLVAVVPPLVLGGGWSEWFYRALVMLVIACPCALVIATPITTVSALARGAREGLLIKGGRYLESLGDVRAVVFDKTGTLTQGKLAVGEVVPSRHCDQGEVLQVAALAERQSEHAIARAIMTEVRALEFDETAHQVSRVEAHPGAGIEAHVDLCQVESHDHHEHDHHHHHDGCGGHDHHHHHEDTHNHPHVDSLVLAGTRGLMERFGVNVDDLAEDWNRLEAKGSTVVGIAQDGEMVGLIECRDTARPEAKAALERLRAAGVREVRMCTGDNAQAAGVMAAEVGLQPEDVRAELFPGDKVAVLEELKRSVDGSVAMIGDGINDAPALAAADIGIAMGAAGTDLALESAHVALMEDRLEQIPMAIELGQRTVRTIRQNVAFAIGTKLLVFGLASAGMATLWMAIAADMGTSLLVIANGLRLLR